MNGFLCVTMTAALSGEGMVRGPCYGLAALRVCVCVRVHKYSEKLLRNVRIHAKDKEFQSHSRETYPLKKYNSPINRHESHIGWK